MDELTSCLVTWLDGHSLIQTVFICLYVHDPYVIEDPCVKAFCVVILRLCEIIRNIINRASVYEEEDFQPMTYGFKLISQVTDLRVSGMLKEAEDEVNRKLKVAKSQRASGQSTALSKEMKELEALWFRLKFWKSFHTAVAHLEKADVTSLGMARQLFISSLKHLSLAKETVDLGLHSNNEGKMLGFEPLVNQRLLPPSFPRHTTICNRSEAFQYLGELIKRLDRASTCIENTALPQLLDFFESFSELRPCVFSRSLLQIIFWNNNKVFGKTSLSEVIQQAIKQFNSPPSIAEKSPLMNNPKAQQFVEIFLKMAGGPITSLIRCMCHNRARQRDKLGFLLEDFSVLQEEADKIDADLHQMVIAVEPKREHFACFGSWVLNRTLTIMIQYLSLGMELQLFSAHEYHYLFWYLDYLFNWQSTCLSRATELLQSHETALEQKSGKSGKKNKKKKRASGKHIQEHQEMKQFYQGMRNLCSGYMKALEGFLICGKMCHPAEQFDSERMRFEHRFFPFQTLDTPQPRLFTQYQETLSITLSHITKETDLFGMSARSFQQAKTTFEGLSNAPQKVDELLKVAKTNFVVMKLAAGGHKHDSQMPPTFDFSVHRSYPTIRLT
ncbi:N-alpha-acetyltransferase 35, NatC auxiliary subunit-like isoform X2 [Dendronephthya gigantea]|nr:N-alpha-acetyltransferase 35, NatC auxiliary subunit-like isoform X2 [Dendronephthya gigantea]